MEGEITHVGDRFRVVYNEQILNPDGTLTVNAVHMYLLGPTAVGDMVIASSRCGVEVTTPTSTTSPSSSTTTSSTTTSSTTTTTTAPTTTTTVVPTSTTTTTKPGNVPTNKDQCKKGGYAAFGFKNQGQCVSFVNHNS